MQDVLVDFVVLVKHKADPRSLKSAFLAPEEETNLTTQSSTLIYLEHLFPSLLPKRVPEEITHNQLKQDSSCLQAYNLKKCHTRGKGQGRGAPILK